MTEEESVARTFLSEMEVPPDNPLTPFKVALGEQLFFDKRLSAAGEVSCETCHLPEMGWTDGKPFSTTSSGSVNSRHTPTLLQRRLLSGVVLGEAATQKPDSTGKRCSHGVPACAHTRAIRIRAAGETRAPEAGFFSTLRRGSGAGSRSPGRPVDECLGRSSSSPHNLVKLCLYD